MNIYNCYKLGAAAIQLQIRREYAFKSKLKIKWVRPEKIPCIHPEKSGDASKLKPLNDDYLLDYRHSKELETADPAVKSLFQLKNNPNYYTTQFHCEMLIKQVQRHPLDYGSMEAKLAKMTATIRRYQEHMEKFPRDVRIKVQLKELIDKRKKFLKYLRRWDYRRFEWVLEKLDLVYKPPPAEFHWITRKESLTKLTNIYCENIKQERLQSYRERIETKLIPSLEEKIASLQSSTHSDQSKAELKKEDVNLEAIEAAQKELEELKVQLAHLIEEQETKDDEALMRQCKMI